MKKVIFKEVGMENYGPYIDPMILTFEENTITTIIGPNGIGKSLSIEAIPFTLFGVTSKGARGDDMVNNVVGKNCKTWVKFKYENDNYVVTRYHKYSKLGNTVIVNKNKSDIKKGQREVLPFIENLLCSQKAFMNTLMFGQKVKDFFTDLQDSDKKEIFKKILGFDKFVLYYKQTDTKLKEAKNNFADISKNIEVQKEILNNLSQQIIMLKEAKNKFYKDKEDNIKELKKLLEENDRLLKKWEEQLQDLEVPIKIEEVENNLSNVTKELDNYSQKIESAVENLKNQTYSKKLEIQKEASEAKIQFQESISKEQQSLQQLEKTIIANLTEINSSLQNEKHKLQLKITELTSTINREKEIISEIKTNVIEADISTCPLCKQDVTQNTKEMLLKKVAFYEENIKQHNLEIEKVKQSIEFAENEANDKSSQLKIKLKEIVNKIEDLKQQTVQYNKEVQQRVQDANSKIETLFNQQKQKIINEFNKEQVALVEKQKELRIQKEEIEKVILQRKKIEDVIISISQEKISINNKIELNVKENYDETQLNVSIKKYEEILTKLNDYESNISSIKEEIEILEFWKTGFSSSGILSMLIDESIPFINNRISEYLDMLTNGRYIVSLDTIDETKGGEFRDKISVKVIDTFTKANSRVQLSGGQTRIIDIAIILTLGDLQTTMNNVLFNILLFDEIFDALDYENAGYVCQVLKKIKNDKSIVIILHQNQDQLEADETLQFRS